LSNCVQMTGSCLSGCWTSSNRKMTSDSCFVRTATSRSVRYCVIRTETVKVARALCLINPLECRGNYSATSNIMKLAHQPLMGGSLHLVRRGCDWTGPQPAQGPPYTKCNSPPINGQRPVYQSPYCCIMVRCSAVIMCLLKAAKFHKPCTDFLCILTQFLISLVVTQPYSCKRLPIAIQLLTARVIFMAVFIAATYGTNLYKHSKARPALIAGCCYLEWC